MGSRNRRATRARQEGKESWRAGGNEGARRRGRGEMWQKRPKSSREGRRRIRRRGRRPVGLVLNPKQTWGPPIETGRRTRGLQSNQPKQSRERANWWANIIAFYPPIAARIPENCFCQPSRLSSMRRVFLRARKTTRFLYLRETEMVTRARDWKIGLVI